MTVTWLSPGAPDQRTGGYLWNARIAAELRASGTEVEVIAVDGRWPMPGVADPAPLAAIPDGAVVVADGLLWPGLGAAGAALAARCRVVVVVHSLLARENGPAARPLGGAAPAGIDAIERRSWTGVKALIATSDATAAEIAADTVSSAAIPVTVVVPGTAPAPRATGGDGRTVLVVGTLTRRKGHDRVLDALAAVTAPWTLVCAGGPRDPAWAAELRAHADRLGIGPRVRWTGELDDAGVDAAYAEASVVVSAARYEAFGMAIAEAVVRGLPVVTTPAGVLGHLPPGAVVVVRDDDALRVELDHLLSHPEARAAQAEAAARAIVPDWAAQARRLAAVLTELG